MVSVVVDRIRVHVSNAEDVDQHTEEGSDEEKHHSDVVNVDSNAKGLRIDLFVITNPSKGQPVSNVM